jgi:hypothetical protein
MVSVAMAALREIALVCEVCLAAEQVRQLAALLTPSRLR